jgi:hypothetical protein
MRTLMFGVLILATPALAHCPTVETTHYEIQLNHIVGDVQRFPDFVTQLKWPQYEQIFYRGIFHLGQIEPKQTIRRTPTEDLSTFFPLQVGQTYHLIFNEEWNNPYAVQSAAHLYIRKRVLDRGKALGSSCSLLGDEDHCFFINCTVPLIAIGSCFVLCTEASEPS